MNVKPKKMLSTNPLRTQSESTSQIDQKKAMTDLNIIKTTSVVETKKRLSYNVPFTKENSNFKENPSDKAINKLAPSTLPVNNAPKNDELSEETKKVEPENKQTFQHIFTHSKERQASEHSLNLNHIIKEGNEIKKNKDSPVSYKSETFPAKLTTQIHKHLFTEQTNTPQNINLAQKEDVDSSLSQREDEFINRLEGRIVSKGEEIILNSHKGDNFQSPNEGSKIKKAFSEVKPTKISYNIVKDYDNLKVNKDAHFLERMYMDIFKRRTKDERLQEFISKQRKKTPEKQIISTFNRLISDANRRMETKQNIEVMMDYLHRQQNKSKKKFNEEEWQKYYQERFIQKETDKKQILELQSKKKKEEEKEKEEKIVAEMRIKKAPKDYVQKVINRVYDESIQRKNLRENCSHHNYLTLDTASSNYNYPRSKSKPKSKRNINSINNTVISTEMPPTFKSQHVPVYNFTDGDIVQDCDSAAATDKSISKSKIVLKQSTREFKASLDLSRSNRKTNLPNRSQNEVLHKTTPVANKSKISKKTPLGHQTLDKDKISSYIEEFRIYVPKETPQELLSPKFQVKVNDLKKRNKNNSGIKGRKNQFVPEAEAWKMIDDLLEKKLAN